MTAHSIAYRTRLNAFMSSPDIVNSKSRTGIAKLPRMTGKIVDGLSKVGDPVNARCTLGGGT